MTTANPQPLPELPKPAGSLNWTPTAEAALMSGYTAEQMHAYALATIAAQGQLDKGELEALERVERGLMLTPLRRVGMGDAAIICAALRRTALDGGK